MMAWTSSSSPEYHFCTHKIQPTDVVNSKCGFFFFFKKADQTYGSSGASVPCGAEFRMLPVSSVQKVWAAELVKTRPNNKQSEVNPHAHSYWENNTFDF